jgi:hypothetical protein
MPLDLGVAGQGGTGVGGENANAEWDDATFAVWGMGRALGQITTGFGRRDTGTTHRSEIAGMSVPSPSPTICPSGPKMSSKGTQGRNG